MNSFNTPFPQFTEEKSRHGEAESNLLETGLPVMKEAAPGPRRPGSRPCLSNHPTRSRRGEETGEVSGAWPGGGAGGSGSVSGEQGPRVQEPRPGPGRMHCPSGVTVSLHRNPGGPRAEAGLPAPMGSHAVPTPPPPRSFITKLQTLATRGVVPRP